ncbi:hypothetical protein L226DRAFT_372728 [Lentinus tigrinus ALCF2SS1-7]|uniref:uncharacterized protein n=1 Tax=Lentinus tigrinus ALCF2SS1-7 TaxID=1328758 RepID=UPI0011662C93|nr:hypothetical protein L226DRAFT_372728 [Lentinus tigrinus ALCF2SS1-7]
MHGGGHTQAEAGWGLRRRLCPQLEPTRRWPRRTGEVRPGPRAPELVPNVALLLPVLSADITQGRIQLVSQPASSGLPPATMSRRAVYWTAFVRRPRLRVPSHPGRFPTLSRLSNLVAATLVSLMPPPGSCFVNVAGPCPARTLPRYWSPGFPFHHDDRVDACS